MQKQKLFVSPEAIYKYLQEMDDQLDTLITCKNNEVELLTTDQALYEAIGSIADKTTINYYKLVKILEVVRVVSHEERIGSARTILTDERVSHIQTSVQEQIKKAVKSPEKNPNASSAGQKSDIDKKNTDAKNENGSHSTYAVDDKEPRDTP